MAEINQEKIDNYNLKEFLNKCRNYRANETDVQEFIIWICEELNLK